MTLLVSSGWTQKKKEITTPVTVNYSLPKVTYVLKVHMECTKQIPGPYRQYAEKELGMKPQIMFLKEKWQIKSINIQPQYVPDEKALYAVTASGDYNPVMLSLSPEGFLAGIAAGPVGQYKTEKIPDYRPFAMNTEREVDMTGLKTYNPLKEVLDTNYIYQEIDGVMKKIWDPIIKYEAKTQQDMVSEAVKEIFRIRTERTKLLASENEVPDGKSLEVILKEFDRMEKDYLSLFMGREVTATEERIFSCTPEKAGEFTVAFRFSESEGIVDKKNVSAVAYGIQVENAVVAGEGPVMTEQPQTVIYYREPAVADVKLMKVNEELQRFRSVVPQLGIIRKFPADVISVEGLVLEFYPEYGSLKSISRK